MSFKPNLSVKEALDHLAKRLDLYIAKQLASHLGGHPWTSVLSILDEKKGFAKSYSYETTDLQAQLRMLTERLGQLGFPFDDKARTVSTLGAELRIVRMRLAHSHDFTVEDAFRASDFCVRLLEHITDREGLSEARRIRLEALSEYAREQGVSTSQADSRIPTEFIAPPEAAKHKKKSAEHVAPAPEVFARKPTFIGDQGLSYEPWAVVLVGDVRVLDDLPRKGAKEKVRAVAVEIAEFEGPIHLDRLVQLTAHSFGLQRVTTARHKKIAYQIRQTGLPVDRNRFVWPSELDPKTWNEFRPNDSSADRSFLHIAPREIANAGAFLQRERPDIPADELERSVLQTFWF